LSLKTAAINLITSALKHAEGICDTSVVVRIRSAAFGGNRRLFLDRGFYNYYVGTYRVTSQLHRITKTVSYKTYCNNRVRRNKQQLNYFYNNP
jgi:hypothetical protein